MGTNNYAMTEQKIDKPVKKVRVWTRTSDNELNGI